MGCSLPGNMSVFGVGGVGTQIMFDGLDLILDVHIIDYNFYFVTFQTTILSLFQFT